MVFTPWDTAHGEANPAYLQCRAVTEIAPMDDSVDTNTVVIEGAGLITSFGDCQRYVLKRIKFVPLVLREGGERAAASILLENSTHLNLLSGQRRTINAEAYGMYMCDGDSNWNEVYFVQKGTALATGLDDRLTALEQRVAALEGKA